MPWPIYLDRTVVIRKRIQSSKAEVLKILLDGEAYTRLQPFVKEVSQSAANPGEFRVTEHVPTPFRRWTTRTSFTATFVPAEDDEGQGVDIAANLDMSFFCPKLKSSVRVKETEEPGVVEVVEIGEMQAFCLMSAYITGRYKEAHVNLLESLAERAERRTKVEE